MRIKTILLYIWQDSLTIFTFALLTSIKNTHIYSSTLTHAGVRASLRVVPQLILRDELKPNCPHTGISIKFGVKLRMDWTQINK